MRLDATRAASNPGVLGVPELAGLDARRWDPAQRLVVPQCSNRARQVPACEERRNERGRLSGHAERVDRCSGTRRRKSSQDVAEAQVQQGRAAVENATLNLQYCSIRSPIDGRAGRRLVDIGNVVTANNGSLLTIQRLDPIYADFTVTENDLSAVQRNMRRGTLDVEVRLPDEPDSALTGALTFLDNAVQDGTGNVTLRATIPNAGHRLWPGRFVKVRLVLSTLPGAVLVPAAAPQMSARGQFVYVVKQDATAELRLVKTGQRHGDLVVIDQGVSAGERVVVNGQLGVTPGGQVREEPNATAKAPDPTNPRGES